MDHRYSLGHLFLLLSLTYLVVECYSSSKDDLKTYIVYMGKNINDETSSLLLYQNMLQQVTKSNQEPKPILQHYKRSFNGFVVNLTKEEASQMAGLDGVVSVFENKKRHLHTTRSWNFIGLTQYVERGYYESDVIVGVIDSGVWPESASFNDEGFTQPPAKWKGSCDTSNFTCNNKIIGARHYLPIFGEPLSQKDIESPRDSTGHGTHTASTVAGNPVNMASMLGLAQGTARGGAPSARIAVYKVCWSKGCFDSSILAAFDDAIADGVDILSVSLGSDSNVDTIYFRDAISIGAFHAMRHGVLTVVSAGNSGPGPSSLNNFSPWTIVVGANTLDRRFVTKVKLGDNRTYEGVSLNTFDLEEKLYPLVYGGDVPNIIAGFDQHESRFCSPNTLDHKLVNGKIVLCEGNIGALEALRAGAVGVLTQKHTFQDGARPYPLPACTLQSKDAADIHEYIRSTRSPSASILRTTELYDDKLAPQVASFSSRGPNNATSEILKPDLTAPGVNIIASWPSIAPIYEYPGESRKIEFNVISGTSMSCPHVSGAAAYIKSFHPTWSPAAIRSALMTTAKQMSSGNNGDAEFGYGAGEINPIEALNPGLVYDANVDDYIRFLCGQGFNTTVLQLITGEEDTCFNTTYTSARDLNYPSFALKAPSPKHRVSGSFIRTVTNVGLPISTYKAIVTSPKGLHITVNPCVLSFTSVGEKKTFVLTIDGILKKAIGSASLIWDDGTFKVRSPIVVYDERAEKEAPSSKSYVRVAIVVGSSLGGFIILVLISIVIVKKCRQRSSVP